MNLFQASCYKAHLRDRIRERRQVNSATTLKYLASKIPIQYTYLSRALRDPKVHLNADDLFTLGRLLGHAPDELDFLLLLRAIDVSENPLRRAHLEARRDDIRRSRDLAATPQPLDATRLGSDGEYLLDPTALLVHVSLFIREYAENPRRLCAPLGLTPAGLDRILRKLAAGGFVDLGTGGTVEAIRRGRIHFGVDHPLTRAHQALCKTAIQARLVHTEEKDKRSFLTTFAADEETFQKLQERFSKFLSEAEQLVASSRPKATYQMAFDLFRWV